MESSVYKTSKIIDDIIKIIDSNDTTKSIENEIKNMEKFLSPLGIAGILEKNDILTKAISNNQTDIVNCLLEYGVSPNYYTENVKIPPLHQSIIQLNYYIFKALLDKGVKVNVNAKNKAMINA